MQQGAREDAARTPRESRQNLCFLARERARERERKRTRNKNLKFFGYVHVYEHEHVHVVISKVRLWGRFCRASLGLHLVFESSGIGAAHFEARHASTDPLLYLVGDSKESFDPICGMGMSHALATGIAAAHFIGGSCEGSIAPSRALAAYHRCQERMARGIRLYSRGVQTLVNWYRRAPLCFAPLSPSLAGRCVAALQSSIKPLRSFDAPHVSMQESCAEQLTNS